MLTLGLNTAFSMLEAALARDGKVLAEWREAMPRGQERRLPGLVAGLCAEAGVALGELSRIGVVAGPGSFTGLRIGVAYARGLALVTGARAVGLTSLEAAIPVGFEGLALGCLAAQRRPPDQTWWVQAVCGGQGTGDVEEVALEALQAKLAGFQAPVFLQGSEALGPLAADLDLRPMQPCAVTAALKAGLFDPARHPPAPVYARAPDATPPAPKV